MKTLVNVIACALLCAASSAFGSQHWAIPLSHQSFPDSKDLQQPTATVAVEVDGDALVVRVSVIDKDASTLRGGLSAPDSFGDADSHVLVYIDPTGDARFAQVFGLNIAGSIHDGLYRESGKAMDAGIDFVWDGKVVVSSEGWQADFRIPLRSLYLTGQLGASPRLYAEYQRIGDGKSIYSTHDTSADGGCLLCQAPRLSGFTAAASDFPVWTLRPTVVSDSTKTVSPTGAVAKDSSLQSGFDFTLQPSPSWVVAGTYHPNFSDREPDQPVLTKDVQFAPWLAETRPFFAQGSDLHPPLAQIINTRQLENPSFAVQAIGRPDKLSSKWLYVDDVGGGALITPGIYSNGYVVAPKSRSMVGRGVLTQGNDSYGMTAMDRDYGNGAGSNQLVAIDGLQRLGGDSQLMGVLARSRSTACTSGGVLVECAPSSGYSLSATLTRNQDLLDTGMLLNVVSNEFRNDLGWQPQSGFRFFNAWWWPSSASNLPMGLSRIDWQPQVALRQDSEGRSNMELVMLGARATFAAGPIVALTVMPMARTKLAAEQALFNQRTLDLSLTLSPSTTWIKSMVEVTVGELPDFFNARPGRGYNLSLDQLVAVSRSLSIHLTSNWATSRAADTPISSPSIHDGSALLVVNYQYQSQSRIRWATQWQRSFGWSLAGTADQAFSNSNVAHSIAWIHEPRVGLSYSLTFSRQVTQFNNLPQTASRATAKIGYGFW